MMAVTSECRLCRAAGPHPRLEIREMMFGTREVFEYFSCSACDTLQIVNVLEGEDLMRHYPATYYSHNGSGQPSALQWLVTQRDRRKLDGGGRVFGALMSRPIPEGIFRVLLGGDAVNMLAELESDATRESWMSAAAAAHCWTGSRGSDSAAYWVPIRSSRRMANRVKAYRCCGGIWAK